MESEALHRGQFTFYASFFDAVERLPKSRRYEALSAIIRYGLDGVEPRELSGAAASVFAAVRPNLDSARVKAAKRLAQKEAETDGFVPPTGWL